MSLSDIEKNLAMMKEYNKLATRIRRNGDPNIVLSKGRKTKSASHKKRVTEIRLAKNKVKRQIERERLIQLGYTPNKGGRPKKVIESIVVTD
jgi:hypothetical protein